MLVLFDVLKEMLPREPDGMGIWTDGEQILCRTRDQADTLSSLLQLTDRETYPVHYYDPDQDRQAGDVDRYTGWYYVYIE